MNRRGFMLSALAAPFVVQAGVLMPVKALDMPEPTEPGFWGRRNGVWRDVRSQVIDRYSDSITVDWQKLGIDKFLMKSNWTAARVSPVGDPPRHFYMDPMRFTGVHLVERIGT